MRWFERAEIEEAAGAEDARLGTPGDPAARCGFRRVSRSPAG